MTLGFSATGYVGLFLYCRKLRNEAINDELKETRKDTTRPSNVYYGINWGYRSDNTIEKSLDTGDLIFFNYHWKKCLYPTDLIKCYI